MAWVGRTCHFLLRAHFPEGPCPCIASGYSSGILTMPMAALLPAQWSLVLGPGSSHHHPAHISNHHRMRRLPRHLSLPALIGFRRIFVHRLRLCAPCRRRLPACAPLSFLCGMPASASQHPVVAYGFCAMSPFLCGIAKASYPSCGVVPGI